MPLSAFVIYFTDVDFFLKRDSFSQPFQCLQKFLVSKNNQLEVCQRNIFGVLYLFCAVASSSPRKVFYLKYKCDLLKTLQCLREKVSTKTATCSALSSISLISLISSLYTSLSFTASSRLDLFLFYKCRNGDVLIHIKFLSRTFSL